MPIAQAPRGTLPALLAYRDPKAGGPLFDLFQGIENMQSTTSTSATNKSATSQSVIAIGSALTSTDVKPISANFEAMLKKNLPTNADGKISEEELFSSLVRERIAATKGEDAATKYDTLLTQKREQFTSKDGFIRQESAAKSALSDLVSNGTLSKDEGNVIYSESFAGAQLDSHTDVLWDSKGGKNDPTKAVEAMDAALAHAKLNLQNMISGTDKMSVHSFSEKAGILSTVGTKAGTTSLASSTVTPKGTSIDGSGGFLFKPISNNENKLAVILPSTMAHLVEDVVIKDSTGKVIDQGRSTGFGDAGTNEKFAFNKQGAHYPKNITVNVKLSSGKTISYKIPDPSKRYD